MHHLIAACFFLTLTIEAVGAERVLITQPTSVSTIGSLTFDAPFSPEITASLELGDTLSGGTIKVIATERVPYRISVQLETSMTISDEGPHLDLTDWKHCTTGWIVAEPLGDSIFALPSYDNVDTDCFPEVTHQDIREAVFQRGGERWLGVVERASESDGFSPVSIELSTVRIKVEKQVNSRWEHVTLIDLAVPMGC